jgi:uncharacterized protein (DUF885 family)
MRKNIFFVAFASIVIWAGCNSNSKSNTDQNAAFQSYEQTFIDHLWKLNPSFATDEGFHNYDSILQIPTTENTQMVLNENAALQDSLHTFSPEKLSDNNKTDYYLIENYFQSTKWYVDTFKQWRWDPTTYNVAGEFDLISSRRDIPLNDKLSIISKRLTQVPAYFAAAKKNISDPTEVHTDLAIDQNEGSLDVFNSISDSVKASTLSDDEKKIVQNNLTTASDAVKDYVKFLSDTVKPSFKTNPARSFRIGKEFYDRKFYYDIQSKYTAEEIYQIAEQHESELIQKMYGLSQQLWSKYMGNTVQPKDSFKLIRDVIDRISLNHCKKDSFLQTISAQIPVLEKYITSHHLVYYDTTKPLVVRKTPEYMEGGGAGASLSAPGPYAKGDNSYYNVTPLTNYSDAEAESYLREYNYYTLQILSSHEGVPGHYIQLQHANMSPSIVKSIFGNTAMIEGWAVYGERMMLENGYGNNAPEMWLMYYKWNLRETMNTILDYSVHCLNMSKEDALNMLINKGFQEEAEANGKWHRVSLTQVQLDAYFTGSTEILALREEYKQKLGDKYSLYDFHNKFLSYGSVPVKYIREMMMTDSTK